ncbi:MAG: CBS domain-containing protein [Deltaproteobacteria bacterium]|nr:CBS domain-containing protein [Deltaproteobacteria bacterium]
MGADKRVKDIMAPIEEYEKIDAEACLADAMKMLKENYHKINSGMPGNYHKTLLVTDAAKKIIGKLSTFDLIRGLVPEPAKEPEHSRAYYSVLSSRTLEVAEQVGDVQERFKWLHTSFFDLVKQESQKKVKDVMSPIHPLLEEDDTISKAIYIMFKEHIRQPMVMRKNEILGIVNIMDIFPVLLEIAAESDL